MRTRLLHILAVCLMAGTLGACSSTSGASRPDPDAGSSTGGTGGTGGRGGAGGTGGRGGQAGAGAGATGGSAPGGAGGTAGTGATAGAGGTAGVGGAAGTGGTAGSGTGGTGGIATPDGAAPPPDAGAGEVPAATGTGPAGYVCPAGQSWGDPLPASRVATMVCGGFQLAEGPVWVDSQKALFFSDFSQGPTGTPGRIRKHVPGTATCPVAFNDIATNGLAVDHQGMIIGAYHQQQRLERIDPATGMHAPVPGGSMYMGNPFNTPNDVVVRADGNIYFTDPSYQRGGRGGQDATAYYRLSPAGQVTRIASAQQPNGIALSPDGRSLYVAGSFPLRKYNLAADGTVGDMVPLQGGTGSDGMAVDCAGNVYLTSGGGVRVFNPNGQMLGMITGTSAGFITNAAFGDEDRRTLYITTSSALYRIRLNVPGFPN